MALPIVKFKYFGGRRGVVAKFEFSCKNVIHLLNAFVYLQKFLVKGLLFIFVNYITSINRA